MDACYQHPYHKHIDSVLHHAYEPAETEASSPAIAKQECRIECQVVSPLPAQFPNWQGLLEPQHDQQDTFSNWTSAPRTCKPKVSTVRSFVSILNLKFDPSNPGALNPEPQTTEFAW